MNINDIFLRVFWVCDRKNNIHYSNNIVFSINFSILIFQNTRSIKTNGVLFKNRFTLKRNCWNCSTPPSPCMLLYLLNYCIVSKTVYESILCETNNSITFYNRFQLYISSLSRANRILISIIITKTVRFKLKNKLKVTFLKSY